MRIKRCVCVCAVEVLFFHSSNRVCVSQSVSQSSLPGAFLRVKTSDRNEAFSRTPIHQGRPLFYAVMLAEQSHQALQEAGLEGGGEADRSSSPRFINSVIW